MENQASTPTAASFLPGAVRPMFSCAPLLTRVFGLPWPPGFMFPNCDCCGDCGPIRFTDDFSSSLSGYTDVNCSTGSTYGVSGGILTDNYPGVAPYLGNSGTHSQDITIPALDGLVMCIQATILVISGKTNGSTGVFMGYVAYMGGRYAFPTPATTPYACMLNTSNSGCGDSPGTNHNFGTANTNFADGDVVKLVLRDVSAGAGTYDVESWVNGTLRDTHSSVSISLTAGNTLKAGATCSNGGQWNDMTIWTT